MSELLKRPSYYIEPEFFEESYRALQSWSGDRTASLKAGTEIILDIDSTRETLEEKRGETFILVYDGRVVTMAIDELGDSISVRITLNEDGTAVVWANGEKYFFLSKVGDTLPVHMKHALCVGGLPNGLEECSKLESLVVIQSETIRIEEQFDNLKMLRKLDFTVAKIDNYHFLTKLPTLKELVLYECGLQTLDEIPVLEQLEVLNVGMSDISDLSLLQHCQYLRKLGVRSTKVSDLSPLSKLTTLDNLNISYCPFVEDVSPIASLHNLKKLFLSYSPVADLSSLSTLTQMQKLIAIAVPARDISALSTWTKLEYVNLDRSKVADLGALKELPILRVIRARMTDVVDGSDLKALPQLEELFLGGRIRLHQDHIEAVQQALKEICVGEIDDATLMVAGKSMLSGDTIETNNAQFPYLKIVRAGTPHLFHFERPDIDITGTVLPFDQSVLEIKLDVIEKGVFRLLIGDFPSGLIVGQGSNPPADVEAKAMLLLGNRNLKGSYIPKDLLNLGIVFNIDLRQLSSLKPSTSIRNLRVLGCSRLRNLNGIHQLPNLRMLKLSGSSLLQNISPLKGIISLKKIYLDRCTTLKNLTPLQHLKRLTHIDLRSCLKATDISFLRGMNNIIWLSLKGIKELSDISPLSSLKRLINLNIGSCAKIESLAPLSELTGLKFLYMANCSKITDLSPISNARLLRLLDITSLTKLKDLSPIANFPDLEKLHMNRCNLPTDVSSFRQLRKLKELKGENLIKVTDLSALSVMKNIEVLRIKTKAADASFLSNLTNLEKLLFVGKFPSVPDLSTFTKLKDLRLLSDALLKLPKLPPLKRLNLTGCASLKDIATIKGMDSLEYFEATMCGNLLNVAPLGTLRNVLDIDLTFCLKSRSLDFIRTLPQLKSLNLELNAKVEAIPDFSNNPNLESLKLFMGATTDYDNFSTLGHLKKLSLSNVRGTKLLDLSALSALEFLKIENAPYMKSFEGIEKLSTLKELQTIKIPKLDNIDDIAALTKLEVLHISSLSLSNLNAMKNMKSLRELELTAPKLKSLQGLRNNASAESITLKESSYLPESEWNVLLTLPSLQKLGGFRESFSAGILSVLSAKRRDRKIIGKEIVKWRKAAKVFPTEEKLLSNIALAGETLLPDRKGALAICDMIKLSQKHDTSDVSELYSIAFRNSNNTMIQTALEAVFVQEEMVLPPATLLAISQNILEADAGWAKPLFEPIKNTTLRVFCTEVQKEKPAAWLAQTLHVLYVHFNNPHALVPAGFQTEEDTKTQLFQLLGEEKLPATSALEAYGILAEEHVSIEEENARTETNRMLISIGLSLFDNSMRDEALSRLIKSIGKAADGTWSRARLDELLRESMRVNPDASTLLAAVAHSHASAGRWLEMEQVAFSISDIGIRDTCLESLSDFIIQSNQPDKSRKALSLLNGLQDTKKRLSRLSQLGQRDVLHADPVAYGQLLTLLIEHSETQLQVIQKAISINPELGDIRPSSLNAPVTDREKRLVEMALQER